MFTKLETKDMEEICNGIYKKLSRMSKELKVSTEVQGFTVKYIDDVHVATLTNFGGNYHR